MPMVLIARQVDGSPATMPRRDAEVLSTVQRMRGILQAGEDAWREAACSERSQLRAQTKKESRRCKTQSERTCPVHPTPPPPLAAPLVKLIPCPRASRFLFQKCLPSAPPALTTLLKQLRLAEKSINSEERKPKRIT